MNYNKTVKLCNILKCTLIDPASAELGTLDSNSYFKYWTPIIKSGEYGNSKSEYDTQARNRSNNFSLKAGQCLVLDTTSNDYVPKECKELYQSFCKVK